MEYQIKQDLEELLARKKNKNQQIDDGNREIQKLHGQMESYRNDIISREHDIDDLIIQINAKEKDLKDHDDRLARMSDADRKMTIQQEMEFQMTEERLKNERRRSTSKSPKRDDDIKYVLEDLHMFLLNKN